MTRFSFPFNKELTSTQVIKLLIEQEILIRAFKVRLENVGFDTDSISFDLGAIILSLGGKHKRSDSTWHSYDDLINKYALSYDEKTPSKYAVEEVYKLILALPA